MYSITNYTIAPIRVMKDKTIEIFKKYILSYMFNNYTAENTDITRYYDRISTYNQMLSFFSEPTLIVDNIYLGNAYNAASYYSLKEKNIKIIFNITDEISEYYPDNFIYENYQLSDNNRDSIQMYLKKSFDRIRYYQENEKNYNILIHCFMGASRSASIVLYYLLKTMKIDDKPIELIDALSYIKSKREIANPTYKLLSDIRYLIYQEREKENKIIIENILNSIISKLK